MESSGDKLVYPPPPSADVGLQRVVLDLTYAVRELKHIVELFGKTVSVDSAAMVNSLRRIEAMMSSVQCEVVEGSDVTR